MLELFEEDKLYMEKRQIRERVSIVAIKKHPTSLQLEALLQTMVLTRPVTSLRLEENRHHCDQVDTKWLGTKEKCVAIVHALKIFYLFKVKDIGHKIILAYNTGFHVDSHSIHD